MNEIAQAIWGLTVLVWCLVGLTIAKHALFLLGRIVDSLHDIRDLLSRDRP